MAPGEQRDPGVDDVRGASETVERTRRTSLIEVETRTLGAAEHQTLVPTSRA